MVQSHNTLDDNDRLGLHMDGLRLTITLDVRIGRLFDRLTILQFLDVLRQQFPVESIGMVEVDSCTFLGCQISRIVIIRVKRYYCCTMRRQRLGNSFDDGGLARTRTTCNSNDCHSSKNLNTF